MKFVVVAVTATDDTRGGDGTAAFEGPVGASLSPHAEAIAAASAAPTTITRTCIHTSPVVEQPLGPVDRSARHECGPG